METVMLQNAKSLLHSLLSSSKGLRMWNAILEETVCASRNLLLASTKTTYSASSQLWTFTQVCTTSSSSCATTHWPYESKLYAIKLPQKTHAKNPTTTMLPNSSATWNNASHLTSRTMDPTPFKKTLKNVAKMVRRWPALTMPGTNCLRLKSLT